MLGATTVLCCDKTGTLTENRMSVVQTWTDGRWHGRGAGEETAMLDTAALACEPTPFDPMERALLDAAAASGPARAAAVLEQRYPLAAGFLAVCHGWRLPSGARTAALKGAPETVLGLCALAPGQHAAAHAAAVEAAAHGLRLLGVARAAWDLPDWPEKPGTLAFTFLGFVALADPLRSTVPAAIALCRRAGIRVVMITGDHPGTARAIAAQAGIDATHVLSGARIDSMDDAALSAAAKSTQVFARVSPVQKLRLVEALRAAGEIVAMTGDGVNDAPALRAAHIGIAMGRRGTDVAREAAALVLLEDDFSSIVATVSLGRRIHDNIRNAMRYLVAVHVPLAGMAFVPLIAGWPLFVLPVHVVFLQFVIDPACTLVFEAESSEPHLMDRPPRPATERLFGAAALAFGLTLGASLLAVVALTYGWGLAAGLGAPAARALAFAALVCGNLGLILANRSHALTAVEVLGRPNPALWWIVGGTLASLCAAIYVPGLADLFTFAPLKATHFAAACALGFVSVAWYDGWKLARRAPPQRLP
jgi:Ca2+-transporting ATPase